MTPDPGPSPVADARHLGAVLRELHEAATRFERGVGSQLDAGPTDMAAMQHLVVEGPLTPGQLAERLGVTPAAATLVVDRLAGLGHVERRRHPDDRRKVAVVPVDASAKRAVAAIAPVVQGVAAAAAELDPAERAAALRFLERVLGVYREAASAVSSSGSSPRGERPPAP